jgi:hypothetical protein
MKLLIVGGYGTFGGRINPIAGERATLYGRCALA